MSSATVGLLGAKSRPSFAPALVLLGVAIVINYVDRGNLSIAAPLVQTDLGLSATKLGVLLSGFFYTYTALQFVVGGVVDRFGANLVLSAGLLLWSLATIATGFAGGFVVLMSLRLLLGIGESVAFPCTSKVIAENVAHEHRGLANGVITAGLKLGPAVSAFGAGLLIAKFGWRSVFLWTGITSLLWLPAWFKWMPKPAASANSASQAPISELTIFKQRGFWACSAGHFCFNYLSYFLMSWLPFYLAHERHLSQLALSKAAGTYYLVDSASALFTGWFCDRLIMRGARIFCQERRLYNRQPHRRSCPSGVCLRRRKHLLRVAVVGRSRLRLCWLWRISLCANSCGTQSCRKMVRFAEWLR